MDGISKDFRPLGGSIEEGFEAWRADDYLAKHYRFLSRAGWQKRIRQGEVRVNGVPFKPSYRLKERDRLHYYHPASREPEFNDTIEPLWKQGDVMVVAKPAGIPMHENGPYRFNTVAHQLTKQFGPGWAAVHRLDRETSGAVMCARTPDAREFLHKQFQGKTIAKTYLALVKGEPEWDQKTVDAPIDDLATSVIRIKKWVVPGGQHAVTHFTKVASNGELTWVLARPVTGRTNQIRIHAAWLGYPLLGDKLYHPDEAVFLEYYEKGMTDFVERAAGFPRLCLHAWKIAFVDPATREIVEVLAPLPDELGVIIDC